jgi:rhodanese-related sulfurtransferase
MERCPDNEQHALVIAHRGMPECNFSYSVITISTKGVRSLPDWLEVWARDDSKKSMQSSGNDANYGCMTSHRFGWLVCSVLCACSGQSHSGSNHAAAGTTTTGNGTGGTTISSTDTASSGGTTSTINSSSGGIANTGGTSVLHNGGRPTTSWQPTACGGSSTLGSVSISQLYYGIAQSPRAFLLINVQVPVSGHIPTTDVDINYTDVAAVEQFIGDDKSQPVILYSATESMSTTVGSQAVSDGYCNVNSLAGGMDAWRDTGYVVEP